MSSAPPSTAELAPLREEAARARYAAELAADGRLELTPAGTGAAALAARLLLALERVQARGAWERLKACPAGDCQWAFYDGSRNRSRTWCSMEECGNREKTRRYRSRKASSWREASFHSACSGASTSPASQPGSARHSPQALAASM